MRRIASIVVVSVALLIAADGMAQTNQSSQSSGATQGKAPPNSAGIMSTTMVIGGKPANIAIANQKLLRDTLLSYRVRDQGAPPNPTLGQLITEIETANSDSSKQAPGMSGFAGVMGHAFLDAAKQAILNGNYNRQTRVELSFHGQIEKYVYNTDGSGELTAVTYITRTIIPAGNGTPNGKTEAFKWELTIQAGGFSVVAKGNNPASPFPGTLSFTPEMRQRIDSLGFMYKLWAKGTKIKIDRIWHVANTNNMNWIELKDTNPKYAKLFDENAENCIDMLFVDSPPPDLNGMGPPLYCLGRCANPLLVNTGL